VVALDFDRRNAQEVVEVAAGDRVPNDARVNAAVFVTQDAAHVGDPAPRNTRVIPDDAGVQFEQTYHGFGNTKKVVKRSLLEHGIAEKLRTSRLREGLPDGVSVLQNIEMALRRSFRAP